MNQPAELATDPRRPISHSPRRFVIAAATGKVAGLWGKAPIAWAASQPAVMCSKEWQRPWTNTATRLRPRRLV